MDKQIRLNQICVIGLPACDFVFSSTRTCFIAYGFDESALEMTILRDLLEQRGIQPVEAGGSLAPGQSAFCAKICSRIITAQFCIVLLNNEVEDGREIPNANVNMEYGLMLGFNKYVIPFQRQSQNLPFNVAGLDTIKYTDADFKRSAGDAIDHAIQATRQDAPPSIPPDHVISAFLLSKKALVTPLEALGDRTLYQIGQPLGFNLLNDFSALDYMYFGNFPALRAEAVVWRLKMLAEILDARRSTLDTRVRAGPASDEVKKRLHNLLKRLQIWVLVTSQSNKEAVEHALRPAPLGYKTEVFSIDDVRSELAKLAEPAM